MSHIYFSKNLRYLRTRFKYSQEQVAEKLEISRSAYKDYELQAFPKPDILIKIADLFQITIDQVLRFDLEEYEQSKIHSAGDNLKILSIVVDKEDKEYIQFVPEKARAGYLTGYANPMYVGELPSFRLPNLPLGTYRAFEISGDSMPPITDKSLVIGKYVENFNHVRNLATYVIVTKDEGINYKRVINKAKEGKIICLSDNAYYEPYTLKTEDIMEMWSYHCHIDFKGQDTPQRLVYKELLDSMANSTFQA